MLKQIYYIIFSLSLALLTTACSNSKTDSSINKSTVSSSNKNNAKPLRRGIYKNSKPHLLLEKKATDPNYGYSKQNPIKVGGVIFGPQNERKFLNALTGPKGQEVTYRRLGSCCHFKSKNGYNGGGLLDIYTVSYKGLQAPVILYLNMYDEDELFIPKGFLAK